MHCATATSFRLLTASEEQFAILNSGDGATIDFPAARLPPREPGSTRTLLLYDRGWIKEENPNSLADRGIEPFPGSDRESLATAGRLAIEIQHALGAPQSVLPDRRRDIEASERRNRTVNRECPRIDYCGDFLRRADNLPVALAICASRIGADSFSRPGRRADD